jgi:hypothetical protein
VFAAAGSIAAVLAGGNVSEAASALFTVTSAVAIVPPKLSTPAVPVCSQLLRSIASQVIWANGSGLTAI